MLKKLLIYEAAKAAFVFVATGFQLTGLKGSPSPPTFFPKFSNFSAYVLPYSEIDNSERVNLLNY
jgi:hypothetical protein